MLDCKEMRCFISKMTYKRLLANCIAFTDCNIFQHCYHLN